MERPLVSIIINNYNYGRFLGAAIDSALGQTYPHIEVVVVDDGSTDNSREVISFYGSRIVPVLKENGGQASTFNAGFLASRGELICMLDSDDLFMPEKASEIVKAWQRYPDAVLFYHRMQVIDNNNAPKGRPWPIFLWTGLIRDRVERSGGWWPRAVTSGLCFSRSYLDRVLPMPVEGFRLCADAYVGDLAPFLGRIVGVPKVLTLYRLHGQNYWSSFLDRNNNGIINRSRQYAFEHVQLKKALTDMGIHTSITLNRHLPYSITTHILERKPSFWRVVLMILTYPSLGYISRIYQLTRFLTKRF